jgi:hypothetical protein
MPTAIIRSQSKRSKWVMYPTLALAIVNFLAFIIGSVVLGGDAINGYAQAGHYFLCAHGGCTEVTQSIWKYSYWHTISAMGGIVLVFIEAAIFVTTGDIVLEFPNRA